MKLVGNLYITLSRGRIAFVTLLLIAASSGCAKQIWNASDLVEWVKDRAIEKGCERQSIELNEWYEKSSSGNIWLGSCINAKTGKRMDFRINVDSVWTPSEKN